HPHRPEHPTPGTLSVMSQEHATKIARLVSQVAVALCCDGRLTAAGRRDDVNKSVRRGCGKHLGIG
ncbi:hypothetical protein, partial [uncultured Actinomyces sp.]|uniref:hypothetical protein n=1 Tax=uncultured Actinomyces sp. TaxID=249061 RepID=UPI0028E706A7